MKSIWGIFGISAKAPAEEPVAAKTTKYIETLGKSIFDNLREDGLVLEHVKITKTPENMKICGNLSVANQAKSKITILIGKNDIDVQIKNGAGVVNTSDFLLRDGDAAMIGASISKWLDKRLSGEFIEGPYLMQPMNEIHI